MDAAEILTLAVNSDDVIYSEIVERMGEDEWLRLVSSGATMAMRAFAKEGLSGLSGMIATAFQAGYVFGMTKEIS